MKSILKKLNIDETFTRPVFESKNQDSIKENIPLVEDSNFMADLIKFPKTKKRNEYLLVVVDLATDDFDIEPLKNKKSESVLTAYKQMFKRDYIKQAMYSIRTDSGTEFKGVFEKYLYDNNILHTSGATNRHKQSANVERLNKVLVRLFNGYMNYKEFETGKVYRNWDDVVDIVRDELNKVRRKEGKDPYEHKYKHSTFAEPKYKVGDMVNRISDFPRNALNKKQNTNDFRVGDVRWDLEKREIKQVLMYPKNIRYILKGFPNVAYAEYEITK